MTKNDDIMSCTLTLYLYRCVVFYVNDVPDHHGNDDILKGLLNDDIMSLSTQTCMNE